MSSRTAKATLAADLRSEGVEPIRAATSTKPRRRKSGPPLPDPRTVTPVKKRPSVDFTLTLLFYVGMTMFMGLAAVNSQANLLYAVFGIMLGILLITYVVCRTVLRRLRVHRVLAEHGSVGRPMTIQYQFHNAKRFWPSLSVLLSELDGAEGFTKQPNAYMFHAAPGTTAVVSIEATPKRRGLHRLDSYQMSTSFPFGFLKMAADRRQSDALLVYPAVGEVSPRLLSLCRSSERGGANMKPRPNGSDEFYGVKEFRDGENYRWIYWKRSARTGQLVAKLMARIAPPSLLIFVDTYIPQRNLADHIAVEKAVAMAGSLASQAFDSGMAVGLCAWKGDWTVISPRRGKRHCRDLLALLADLPLNQTADATQLIAKGMTIVRGNVTPVLFTRAAVQSGLAEQIRGGLMVIAAGSQQAQGWFQFSPTVDFSRCMPAEQQPSLDDATTP